MNGEAIYESNPWSHQNDSVNSHVWFTSRTDHKDGEVVYAILLEWPIGGHVVMGDPLAGPNTEVYLLGYDHNLVWRSRGNEVVIDLPDKSGVSTNWGWVIKMVGLENGGNSLWK